MQIIPTLLASVLPIFSTFAQPMEDNPLAAIPAAVEAKEYGRALELANASLARDPLPEETADVLFKSGTACANGMELDSAAGFYRLLLDKLPDSEHASEARAELLGCYYNLRQLEQSIVQAKVNLKLDPDSHWVEYWHFVIAQCHFRLWRFAEAKPKLEAFLAEYPDGDYAKYAKSCLDKIDPEWEIDENGLVRYAGKYDRDIRLAAAIKSLPEDMETGFRMLEQRLGINLKPHTNVIFLIKDAGSKAKPGLKASTYVVGRDNKPAIVMRFYAEYVVAEPEVYRQTIVHEMKHAGFKGIMGQAYEDLPTWIKEGLAVWGADDVNTRLQLVLSNKIAGGKDPLSVLDGIDDPDRDVADYLEDALAFEWLETKKPGNVKAFCRQLTSGNPYREIWADLSGMSYAEAMAAANAHCRTRMVAALGEAYNELVPLRKAHEKSMNAGEEATRKWLEDGGEAALNHWLKANPGHPAEPFARFCLARALARAGRGDESRELLRQILDEDGLRCTLLDDAQFWIGVSYNWERDHAKAGAAFGVLLRDFPASHSAKQVAGQFQPAGPVTE